MSFFSFLSTAKHFFIISWDPPIKSCPIPPYSLVIWHLRARWQDPFSIFHWYIYSCFYFIHTCIFSVFSEPTLQFLITGLQQKALASAAATALQSICSQCQDQMVGNFSGLLQVAHAVDSFNLSNEAVIGVLKGTFISSFNNDLPTGYHITPTHKQKARFETLFIESQTCLN